MTHVPIIKFFKMTKQESNWQTAFRHNERPIHRSSPLAIAKRFSRLVLTRTNASGMRLA